ncbi:MAG: hypothetical protein TREMPRED_003659 [Tremellales sp. Tagirdzhanova-0007]|nr:MAG: hypothetical protein TREMPRED_003659 [Tremellales sp. Tagirdzhanova-0007]
MTMLTHPQSKLVESESIAPAQSTIIQKAPAFASRILHHTRDGIALTPYNSPAYAPPIAARDHIAASSLRARILVPRPSGEQVMPGNLAKIGYTIANSVTTDEDPTKAQPEPEKMVPTKDVELKEVNRRLMDESKLPLPSSLNFPVLPLSPLGQPAFNKSERSQPAVADSPPSVSNSAHWAEDRTETDSKVSETDKKDHAIGAGE